MKKLLITLLCCIALAGCGNTEDSTGSGSVSSSESLLSGMEDVPKSAETLIGNLIYFDLNTDSDKNITLYFVDDEENIADCLYATFYIGNELSENEIECDMSIVVAGKTYVLNLKGDTMKDIGFPEQWIKFMEDNGIEDGENTIQDFVTKSKADILEREVQDKIIDALKEEIDTEENRETMLEQKYKFDGGTVDMLLSKDVEEEYSFSITITTDIEWKAAYAYTLYSKVTNTEEMKKVNPSVMAFCGDVMITSLYSCKQDDNGNVEQIDSTEWLANAITKAPSGKISKFSDKLAGFLTDFLSK